MPSIHFRHPRADEHPILQALLAHENMPLPETYLDGTVAAEDDRDSIVGYIHIADYDGKPYIAPIVVAEAWRGQGIGAALVAQAFERYEELRLVAEGRSCGFYECLGFEKMKWEWVAADPRRDCDFCPDLERCQPVPYRKIRREG